MEKLEVPTLLSPPTHIQHPEERARLSRSPWIHIPSPTRDGILDINDRRPRVLRGASHRCRHDVVDDDVFSMIHWGRLGIIHP